MKLLLPRLLLPLLALLAGACEVDKIPLRDAQSGTPWPDAVKGGDADAVGPELQPCQPANRGADCPPAMQCEANAKVCVDCVFDEAACTAVGRISRCDRPVVEDGVLVSGGFFVEEPCPPKQICFDPPSDVARCADQLCTPGTSRCGEQVAALQVCDALGQTWQDVPCNPGFACYEGQCKQVRHNVLLLFDTSDSMNQYLTVPSYPNKVCDGTPELPCLEPFPVCEDPEDPITLITRAKHVFAQSIKDLVDDHVQFALQRFPQNEALGGAGSCTRGWYGPRSAMTGDDDDRDTTTAPWFETYLEQAIAVPFPRSPGHANTAELLEWMDFSEGLAANSQTCSVHADCPSAHCGEIDGQRRCFYHSDPELRGSGETPLGKSLFYAGEYFRRYVLVDGKPCESTSDCGSAGYECREGQCVDPFRHCRESHILVFTDGGETQHRTTDLFFNPQVQAKRMAYGLGCSLDEDCRGGATCVGGVCTPPVQAELPPLPYVSGTGHDALSTPGGLPVHITTSVINLKTNTAAVNSLIAMAGGGEFVDVAATDADFQLQLQLLMLPAFKCQASQ